MSEAKNVVFPSSLIEKTTSMRDPISSSTEMSGGVMSALLSLPTLTPDSSNAAATQANDTASIIAVPID